MKAKKEENGKRMKNEMAANEAAETGQAKGVFGNSEAIHYKVISDFQVLRRARAPLAGLESATEGLGRLL
ncbi:hypothetical protein PoB_002501100 [Plakobranchus ocellatus]|uniref:Uncharacterized protein n=1 Tax=Plakobranchus ocellatus TaxID=259542 RepID=A0AAV3ZRB8_9GAST|nr:hypothetical protein PoB_002501100 [Plakobranchus ocellatus]